MQSQLKQEPPTEADIVAFAEWLEISEYPSLYWIAKEGLTAPVPNNWKLCATDEGDVYYFNFETGVSSWDHPMDEYYKKLALEEKNKLLEIRLKENNNAKSNIQNSISAAIQKKDDSSIIISDFNSITSESGILIDQIAIDNETIDDLDPFMDDFLDENDLMRDIPNNDIDSNNSYLRTNEERQQIIEERNRMINRSNALESPDVIQYKEEKNSEHAKSKKKK